MEESAWESVSIMVLVDSNGSVRGSGRYERMKNLARILFSSAIKHSINEREL